MLELKNNLLNIGYLQENGLTVMFHSSNQEKSSCIILIIIFETNVSSNRMFILFVKYPHEEKSCFQVTIEDLQWWVRVQDEFGRMEVKEKRISVL